MVISSRLIFFISSLFMLLTHAIAQPNFFYKICSEDQGNYTTNSTYQNNLNIVLSSLTSNKQIKSGFYSSSHGENPHKVYTTGFCRGDLEPNACKSCLNDSTYLLPKVCPNQKGAIGWYINCTLRYSNHSIYGIGEINPAFYYPNKQNVSSDVKAFNQELMALFENLRNRAVTGDSTSFFAAGNLVDHNHSMTIYGLVQCTPDVSAQDCNDCISYGILVVQEYCYGRKSCLVGLPSCNVAHNISRFYEATADTPVSLPHQMAPPPPPVVSPPPPVVSPPPSPSSTSTGKGKKKCTSRTLTVAVVSPVLVSVVLLIFICFCLRVRKSKEKVKTYETIEETNSKESLQLDLETIREATNDFSATNFLGKGGFGEVFRGRLSNGQDIAVKRLKRDSGQGDHEFKNEVILVARLAHKNLVNLLGFCLEQNEKLLIYEFVPNSSLDRFLFDLVKREQLDWNRRYKIILGIARGLFYLHEESRLKIIHRDLKASNILLDADMNPKIADFGTARLFALDQSQQNTKKIAGTYGYMAPEYAGHGRFSVKSDVFSFGVLVLEIISGQKVNNFRQGENTESLMSYAWQNWREGKAMNLADPKMRACSREEIMRCVHIGLLCVQEKVTDRPTMASVILMLSSQSLALQPPSRPAFYISRKNECHVTEHLSHNNSVIISENEASVTELYPR
ncbi:hypothetical protein UlMin_011568 [Ulmus minor]